MTDRTQGHPIQQTLFAQEEEASSAWEERRDAGSPHPNNALNQPRAAASGCTSRNRSWQPPTHLNLDTNCANYTERTNPRA